MSEDACVPQLDLELLKKLATTAIRVEKGLDDYAAIIQRLISVSESAGLELATAFNAEREAEDQAKDMPPVTYNRQVYRDVHPAVWIALAAAAAAAPSRLAKNHWSRVARHHSKPGL